MRGTCSPSFMLKGVGDAAQIFAVPFAEVAAETQVPFSHVLWSYVWLGIATSAVNRAQCLRKAASASAAGRGSTNGAPPRRGCQPPADDAGTRERRCA